MPDVRLLLLMHRPLLCLLLLLPTQPLFAADACTSLLPSSIRMQFTIAFPGYRPITVSDYSRDTLALETPPNAPIPCLSVASGHFNADRHRDFVFLAVRPKGSVRAFVALRQGKGWGISQLWDLAEQYPGCCYVAVMPPGHYENVYGTDTDPESPLQPNERLEFTSKADVPVVGSVESTGVAFLLSDAKWLHVWISD